MFRSSSILAATAMSLFCLGATPFRTVPPGHMTAPGGPPRVQLADKSGGDISRKTLLAAPAIHLIGCVPTARVIAFSFAFKDAGGKTITYRTREAGLSEQMIATLKNMNDGSSFTITDLDVVDDKGKAYVVPEVTFILRT